jgi:hypothetical protein
MHTSFLTYKRGRYLLAALYLSVLSMVIYLWHSPLETPNGGTWLGYTLGTIGALLILWLLLFGVRKRSYSSRLGTVQSWLSAHVYLGSALLIVASSDAFGSYQGRVTNELDGVLVGRDRNSFVELLPVVRDT